jgi:hypothetical protein
VDLIFSPFLLAHLGNYHLAALLAVPSPGAVELFPILPLMLGWGQQLLLLRVLDLTVLVTHWSAEFSLLRVLLLFLILAYLD